MRKWSSSWSQKQLKLNVKEDKERYSKDNYQEKCVECENISRCPTYLLSNFYDDVTVQVLIGHDSLELAVSFIESLVLSSGSKITLT